MHAVISAVFEPGFFASPQVRTAAVTGGLAAIICAVTGVFTVLRGQSFGGHALGDVSAAGGSGALLLGLGPVVGFVGLGIVGAVVMDLIGVRRARGRDLATGVVLGAAIGLSALFLYLTSTTGATTGAAQQVLFGSIFTVTPGTIPVVVVLGAVAAGGIAVTARPLLLVTVSPDLAAARGVPVRFVSLVYTLALAVSVGLSSLTTGAILSTALLIGPAAAAMRLTRTVATSLVVACLIGLAATWAGILLAYDSSYWGSSHQGLPVSFFIVAVIFVTYLASGPAARRKHVRGWLHDERLDHRDHRGRGGGRDGALRRAPRLGLSRPRHPERGVRGRGCGQPDRRQHARWPRNILLPRSAGDRLARPSRTP
jgi:zinc/manganese transport system permease protein